MIFDKKPDGYILELNLEFNLSEIGAFLKSELKEGEVPTIPRYEWDNPIIQSYTIFVLPIGKDTDWYYHKNINKFSHAIQGTHILNEATHPQINLEKFCNEYGVFTLEWKLWRGCLSMKVIGENSKLLLLAPLEEAALLQTSERTTSTEFWPEKKVIKVPASFNDDGEPESYIEICETIAKDHVIYSNLLASLSIVVSKGEVFY